MNGSIHTDKRNYRSLIIAGIGTIGKSLITLGIDRFSLFEHIFGVDRDAGCLTGLREYGITCQAGDISNPEFLKTVMSMVPGPALFVNLCSGTNNVRIRKNLARHDTAYLDSCASSTPDPDECRFSRMMPHTYTAIDNRYPHWLCWGINPGLVEIIARKILSGIPAASCSCDVSVFEFDRLEKKGASGGAPVGWSPDALVEEVMLSPTMTIVEGLPRESLGPGTAYCTVNWEDSTVPARIVGHEDIWNLAEVPTVRNSQFYYSLSPTVMDIMTMDDTKKARDLLYVPGKGDIICGLEQVAVQVVAENFAAPQTLVWTEDHALTRERFGVNAVQYQTAKSLLLAILLLQRTDYGLITGTFNASNLAVATHDWQVFERFMAELDIDWRDGSHLNLFVHED